MAGTLEPRSVHPLSISHGGGLGGTWVLSEAVHHVRWLCTSQEVQVEVSHSLCPAQGHWHELERDLQMAATYAMLEGAQERPSCHQCWAWGHLARGTEHTQARSCLFGVCEPFRDFKKLCSMSQHRPFAWKRVCIGQDLRESPGWG